MIAALPLSKIKRCKAAQKGGDFKNCGFVAPIKDFRAITA
jgi:hypothetical protein